MKPCAERVRELLDYDPVTGFFHWKFRVGVAKQWNTKNAGKVAGGNHNRGYTHIAIDRIKYLAHHLAWVFVLGEWPTEFIDHKDLNKKNNAWNNLRQASFAENSANASIRNDNKSGFRGVYFVSSRNVWHAKIRRDGVDFFLGSFPTAELASVAYAVKARELYGEYCPQYLVGAAA
jgi:hypothetical protein